MDPPPHPSVVGFHFAVLSGVAAASASVFAKFFSYVDDIDADEVTIFILRVASLAFMVISNGLVWTFFVRALHSSKSSLPATITSAAINYCFSAIFGWLLFSEKTSSVWWTGAMLVLAGLLLINGPQPQRLKQD